MASSGCCDTVRKKNFWMMTDMKFIFLIAISLVFMGGAHAVHDELPQDVLDAYSAYEQAVQAADWDTAIAAAETAAEAGEQHGIDPASRAVLWENLGIAHMRSGKRLDDLDQPDTAFERALSILISSGDEANSLRLRYRLIEAALIANDGMRAFDRMDAFERALTAASIGAPDLERQVLAARLNGSRPPNILYAPPLEDADRRRVHRLLALASPGDADYVIGQTRLIIDAIAREAWAEAEILIFDTTRAVAQIDPEDETRLEDFLGYYSHVLVEGYDERVSSGAERWPADVRETWCGFLDGRAIPTRRTPPIYPSRAAESGWSGTVTLSFNIDEFGSFVEAIRAEPVGDTRHVFVGNSERTLRRWQWRAQCNPRPGVLISDSTVMRFQLAD